MTGGVHPLRTEPERQEAKKPLMAPTKPRPNHETSGAMASASLTDPFFEVPIYLWFRREIFDNLYPYSKCLRSDIRPGCKEDTVEDRN